MSARERILSALAANGFGQAVTIGSQLLLTPLFFRLWGADRYGEWLMLSAIPAYLMLADLGVSSAAANEMAMRVGARDFDGAQQTFRGVQNVVWLATLLALLFGVLAWGISAWGTWLELANTSHHEAAWVLLLLSGQVALGFHGGVAQAGFRCAGFNGFGTTLANIGRLCEALGSAVVLLRGHGALVLCVVTLMVRGVFVMLQWLLLRRHCTWLFVPRVAADRDLFQRLWRPSIAFMAFPVGYALALQGPILIIGSLFGSSAVAVFSAMRTLARLPAQVTNVLNSSVAPEISRAYGEDNLEKIRRLHCSAWVATAVLGLLACVALGVIGPWLSRLWLGAGRHDQVALLSLLVISWVSAVWNVSSIVLTATNQHLRFSVFFMVVNALGLLLAAGFGRVAGMRWLLAGLLLAELVMLAWVMYAALGASKDTFRTFANRIRTVR